MQDVLEAEFKEVVVPIEKDKVDLRQIIRSCMVDIESELPTDLQALKNIPELHIEGKLLIKLFNRGYKIVPLAPTSIKLPEPK